MDTYIFLKQSHACGYEQIVSTGHTKVHCLRSIQLHLLTVASLQLRNNNKKKKKAQNILEFCTDISKMQKQCLEGFAIQTEHSVNIEHVINSYTSISLAFSVLRQDLTC